MLKLLYFASLREQLSSAQEQLELDQSITDISTLKQVLAQRGGVWQAAFEGSDIPLLVSINQQMAGEDSVIKDGDEIAFFPPVTGG